MAQTNVVPDAVELAVLKKLYTDLGGDSWTKRTNWPTVGTWPATATSAVMGTWQGVTVQNGDIIGLSFPAANLVGTLPAEVGDLARLRTLRMDGNKLTGSIPVSLGDLSALTSLNLANNQLSGTLPSSLGNLTNLVQFIVWRNKLSGEIPASFSTWTQLTSLYLYENQFSGTLPALVGCTKLRYIHAHYNYFQGGIPASYSAFTALIELVVYNNDLSGELPSFVGNWVNLTQLLLHDNDFRGAFPSTIGNCTALANLQADNNAFTSLPQEVLNSPVLAAADFRNNALTTIPDFTGYSNNGQLVLSVQNNYLGFDKLERLFDPNNVSTLVPIVKTLQYKPQKVYDLVRRADTPENGTLQLMALSKGVNGNITWEKKSPAGTWINITTSNADASQQTYRIPNVTRDAAAVYRWKNENTRLGMTLQSDETDVRITDVERSGNQATPMYNGLATSVRWRTAKAQGTEGTDLTGMYLYEYDDRYQIRDASWAEVNNTLNTYSMGGNKFRLTGMSYDANGNIKSLHRYDDAGLEQHRFTYTYAPNKNQLTSVSGYTNAYKYDKVGRMVGEDKAAGDDQYVDYDVSGKVVAVYSDSLKRSGDKKVEYQYDDRGFRLTKINYLENRTTWYIRDASGNVLSVYEQEGIPALGNTHDVVETETPVYGSGKLGTYYPQQEGSVAYEVTDHLGNVRALVRENATTYTATMEDSGVESIQNPRVEELQYFLNLQETAKDDHWMNHTSPTATAVSDPSMSAYLYWNDTQGTQASDKATGPAIVLEVSPGDTVTAEAYVRYKEKEDYNHGNFDLTVLSMLLGNNFSFIGGFDGMTTSQATQSFGQALLGSTFFSDEAVNGLPYAYLSYIVFDAEMTAVASKRVRIPVEAGFGMNEETIPNSHERVFLKDPVVVPTAGKYIYVWVSNESPETEVWFDDFRVAHTTTFVSQSTDYGVWGDILRTTSTDAGLERQSIRKGLKGQYAFAGDAQNQAGGMNGTVTGATLTADRDGNASQAYNFDGTDDYITLPGSADGLSFIQNTGVFTITAFIKLSDLSARSVIIGSSGTATRKGFSFAYDTYGNEYGTHTLRFSSTTGDAGIVNVGAGNDYAINDLNWHHVAVVGDGKSVRFYLDGVANGYSTTITNLSTGPSANDVVIGATRNSATGVVLPMHGAIDELHIFDKALSDSEIRLLAAGASTEDIDQVLKPVDRSYRYAYQGQFAELDKETGWSHFESREYDAVIGRWLVPDPAGQHWSPYLAMSNSPVVSVDPNGEIAGTIIGAAIGAGIAAWNGENVWRGALSGAVAGATFDLIVGSAIATGGASLPFIIGAGAVSGAAGALTEQVWDATIEGKGGTAFSAQKTLTGAVWGAAAPIAGKLIGAGISKLWSRIQLPKGIVEPEPTIRLKNGHLAGQTHPRTGVPFDDTGFPDFSRNLYRGGPNDVIIRPTGSRSGDFAAANSLAGYSSTPKGYTWHHHQSTGRMQLVETSIHSQTGHTGGFALWRP
ncbi:LamG-like jellyroll fold domain-containing protein [Parachryseolinea silvisoli]|uniref:LamG-like jellyroll fold domain-containing protein n=1 Tax=Parachryseolinea silvisoli TaxID=2873601 RepID=UPI002265AA95|nr:LamG-like jellyroll fold domain-containing protein [Parachryseolinea silvisoli]MCD9017903.1 HNH endonuclease [Parachryseolinea silvisoli]